MSASSSPEPTMVGPSPLSMGAHVPLAPGSTAKIREPLMVALLTFITLGIYVIFWHYYINREMADYGRARRAEELGDDPVKSTLALFPGAIVVVPAVWTTVTTFRRVQAAERLTGHASLNGWLAIVLFIVLVPVYHAYVQSGLNAAWRASQAPGRQPEPEPVAV